LQKTAYKAKNDNALIQALEECDLTKINQFLNNNKNYSLELCLFQAVKNCCKAFDNKQFEKYKEYFYFLTILLNSRKFNIRLLHFQEAIECRLIHVIKILAKFSTASVIEQALNFAKLKNICTRENLKRTIENNKQEIRIKKASGLLNDIINKAKLN